MPRFRLVSPAVTARDYTTNLSILGMYNSSKNAGDPEWLDVVCLGAVPAAHSASGLPCSACRPCVHTKRGSPPLWWCASEASPLHNLTKRGVLWFCTTIRKNLARFLPHNGNEKTPLYGLSLRPRPRAVIVR